MSPELQSKMILWRAKCNDGTITEAELIEAMTNLRGDRTSASATAAKRKTVKAAIPSADDLLSELDDLDGGKP